MIDWMICLLWGRLKTSDWHFDNPYAAWINMLDRHARLNYDGLDWLRPPATAEGAEALGYHEMLLRQRKES